MSPSRSTREAARWVAVGAAASGILTYVLLFVVGRAAGPGGFAEFNGFWAAVVVTSIGGFLPIEQLASRRTAVGGHPLRSRAQSERAASVVGLVATVLVGALAVTSGRGDALPVALAFAAACLGFVWQFAGRGVLAGQRRLRAYAGVVVVDNVVRTVLAAGLAVAGVREVVPYAAAVAAGALAAGAFARVLSGRGGPAEGEPNVGAPWTETGAVVTALLLMQVVLNSGNLVGAGAASGGPAEAALAGSLVAALAVVRAPVFLQQLAQAAYVSRLAAAVASADRTAVARLLRALAVGVALTGALLVAGAAVLGPLLVRLTFGPAFVLSGGTAALLAAGVAVYLVAAVANDAAVAAGAHRLPALAWVLGTSAAGLVVLVVDDLVLRVGLPLVVGSGVAAMILMAGLTRRLGSVRLPEGAS